MLFNSVTFAIFLPIVFLFHWWMGKKNRRAQNLVLLLASYTFYGFWDWRFLALMFISSVTDFVVGILMHQEQEEKRRKILLVVSLLVNLGILGFFKYFNFFADAFVRMLTTAGFDANPFIIKIILPVGISFYTFQTLSYTIDIYRRKLEPTRDAVAFFTFVAFFPQLMAGPIERAARLLPQFHQKRSFDPGKAVVGLRLFLWGMFKKVVIADRIGLYPDYVYGHPEEVYGWAIVLATVIFSIQVYCDFSAYSDMAIGLAKLFNIDLMTNFRTPFFSRTIKEFWSRWHISLSTWFRDYVYIPLGGNRGGTALWAVNITITFTISGLWHGANYTFLIWGILLGVFYVTESLIIKNAPSGIRLPGFIGGLWTFAAFTIPFLLFRAENLGVTISLINNLGSWVPLDPGWDIFAASAIDGILLMLAFGMFVVIEILMGKENINHVFKKLPTSGRWGLYYVMVALFFLLADLSGSREFVYFQF